MRLVFVNSAWPPSWGGGEKWTIEAADWFSEHGHDVVVVGRPVSKLIAAARVRELPVCEHSFGGDFDPIAIRRARRLLEQSRAELVTVNFNKEAWQFGLAARKLHIPVIARHGFPLLRRSFHHRLLAQKVLSGIVVNARAIREQYARLGFDVSQIPVIHNGIRLPTQRIHELRRRFDIADTTQIVLAAGRVESQKRFDRVIEIAARIVPDHPDTQFLIAGEGPERMTLEGEIEVRGLSKHVRFTGFIPDLAEIIGGADLFLLTSDQEGTPNILLEAMAAGVACVAFAVGSVPEILVERLVAFAIPPGNAGLMSERVHELLNDAEARRQLGIAMRLRTEQEFSLDHSMLAYQQLFKETLRNSP